MTVVDRVIHHKVESPLTLMHFHIFQILLRSFWNLHGRLVTDCHRVVLGREIAIHLAVAGDVSDGVFLCCPFSHEMSWMRSGT